MNKEERDRLNRAELRISDNSKSIEKLTQAIEALTKIVAKEDKHIMVTINEMQKNSALCQQRHEALVIMLKDKKERLSNIEKDIYAKLDDKASKDRVDNLYDKLWKIGGSVIAIILAMLGFLIKMQITGGH